MDSNHLGGGGGRRGRHGWRGEDKHRGREKRKEERRKGQSHFAEPAGLQCTVKLNKVGAERKERRRKEGMDKESVKLHCNMKTEV